MLAIGEKLGSYTSYGRYYYQQLLEFIIPRVSLILNSVHKQRSVIFCQLIKTLRIKHIVSIVNNIVSSLLLISYVFRISQLHVDYNAV